MYKYILIISLISLSACNQQNANNDNSAFEAYLKTKGVSLDDEVRYNRMLAEFQRREALANAAANSDLLDKALIEAEVEELRKELLIGRYFEKYLNDAVTDQGIQNFYSENIDNYKSRKVKVAHILFRVNARMDETERQAILTKALDAHSKVVSGSDFAEIAKEVSEDKVSAAKGGDLGWVNQGAISKAFSEKIFSMKADELSEPFLTDYGFHIVKVTEPPQEVTKPLEAIKGDIRYQLRNESKKAETQRLLDSVSYQAKELEQ